MKAALILLSLASFAAPSVPAVAADPVVQTGEEAQAQDAAAVAPILGLTPQAALLRLKAQAATLPTSERLRAQYRDRLAGLYVEQRPVLRLVVLLTGIDAPAGFTVDAAGLPVPVVFRTGATATRAQVLAAIDSDRAAIAELVPGARGVGHDPRTGAMIVMARPSATLDPAAVEAELTRRTGVPVHLRVLQAKMGNASAMGGGRVEGLAGGHRYVCTTGFVVQSAGQRGVTTAAHCADDMTYRGPDGEERLLTMVGSWGAAYRDVQIHTGVGPAPPMLFSDRDRTLTRVITGWRTRPQTRSGDIVCIRGESSGHSCSEVELVDFAPPGELCGGLCSASWVTVAGPDCRRGDSGSPVFLGGVAYGMLKGGAFLPGGACPFYFYMSTDYLPDGWRVATGTEPVTSVRRPRNPGGETTRQGPALGRQRQR